MESTVWTEKYRPKCFDDIKGQKKIVERLRAFISQKNLPHVLFSGPAGVGKTSLSVVIARELFGENWKQNFLELNASDERGIDVVRVKVKDFARTKAIGDVPFKIIYLDECDALTKEAQQALRRTMENYTKTCRFILSCNYSSKIIDPIQSRCAVFKFKPLDRSEIDEIINVIAKNEGLVLDVSVRDALFNVCDGDCRKMENILQSCSVIDKNITANLIYDMASSADPKEIKEILDIAVSGKFIDARNKLIDTMLKQGLSGLDVVNLIQKEIWNLNIDARLKVSLVDKCGDIEFRMVEGSDEFIQLEALLANFTLGAQR